MADLDSRVTIIEARILDLADRHARSEAAMQMMEANVKDMREDMNDGIGMLKDMMTTQMNGAMNLWPPDAVRATQKAHSVLGVWIGISGTLLLALVTVIAASHHLFP